MEVRPEVIIEKRPPVPKEVIEDAVSPHRDHLSENPVVVIFSSELIAKSVVGLVDFDELGFCLFVAWAIFGMILDGQFTICLFDLIHSGILSHSKHFVVVVERVGVVLVKELLFVFIFDSMLIEEFLKGRVGIFKGVLIVQEFIVVSPFVSVREDLKSLSDIMKLSFSGLSVFFVFVRMPHGGEFFIGAFNLKERGVLSNTENSIVVLEFLAHRFVGCQIIHSR